MDEGQRHSKRVRKLMQRLLDVMTVEISRSTIPSEIFCHETLCPADTETTCYQTSPLLAFKATVDPDTMYMHEAMREPDHAKFL